jgi:hypothetical protein
MVLILLLLYEPGHYHQPQAAQSSEVSPYLTHILSPQLYNGAQRQEPFDLVVIDKGINDIISRSKWPKELDGLRFSASAVLFVPESIILMGTLAAGGVEFVVTVVAEPSLDEQGLRNLGVAKVKLGAMNITPLAKMMAKRIYSERFAAMAPDAEKLGVRIAASLLNDEPFEPVFEVEDKKVRVQGITITHEKLTIRLVPVSD